MNHTKGAIALFLMALFLGLAGSETAQAILMAAPSFDSQYTAKKLDTIEMGGQNVDVYYDEKRDLLLFSDGTSLNLRGGKPIFVFGNAFVLRGSRFSRLDLSARRPNAVVARYPGIAGRNAPGFPGGLH